MKNPPHDLSILPIKFENTNKLLSMKPCKKEKRNPFQTLEFAHTEQKQKD